MRAVVQRVSAASVAVRGRTRTGDGEVVGEIGRGLLVLVGVTGGDGREDAAAIAAKVAALRVFPDADGLMNRSVGDVGGGVLVVSQFTLYGDTRRGRRPSFTAAAPPGQAEPLVGAVVDGLRSAGLPVATGVFGAMMAVSLVNDGPVTLLLETRDGRIV